MRGIGNSRTTVASIALASTLALVLALPAPGLPASAGPTAGVAKQKCKKGKAAAAKKGKCKKKKQKPPAATLPTPAPASLSISPTSWDFGNIIPSAESPAHTFTVTNTGGSPTGALLRTFSGTDSAQFIATADGCQGANLAAGASCSVDAKCQGTVFGDHTFNGSLNVGTIALDVSSTLTCHQIE